jgi:hypothetical protein
MEGWMNRDRWMDRDILVSICLRPTSISPGEAANLNKPNKLGIQSDRSIQTLTLKFKFEIAPKNLLSRG